MKTPFNEPGFLAGLSEEEKYYALLAEKIFLLSTCADKYAEYLQFMNSLSLDDYRGLAANAGRQAAYHGRKAEALKRFRDLEH
jgi:hypothetical protein